MNLQKLVNDISALPSSEQLRVVQAIWDRLPRHALPEVSAAQQAELARRWAEFRANPSTALNEDEFTERIRTPRGQ